MKQPGLSVSSKQSVLSSSKSKKLKGLKEKSKKKSLSRRGSVQISENVGVLSHDEADNHQMKQVKLMGAEKRGGPLLRKSTMYLEVHSPV